VKAQPFLITGLPRSRTAWLSVLCTTGNAFCYHEPSTQFEDISDLKDFYNKDSPRFVGVSDAALGFYLPWIMENIRPKTLIIDRDIEDVKKSFGRLGARTTGLRMLYDDLVAFREHPSVMWVPYCLLDTKRIIEKIFLHLMPGESFDEARYEQLSDMRITINVPKRISKIRNKDWTIRSLGKDKDWSKYYAAS
jgi:hypothetical protein